MKEKNHYCTVHFLVWKSISWESEGCCFYSLMFSWEPEGRYHCTKSSAMAPFWFSMEHCWTALTPFWLTADDIGLVVTIWPLWCYKSWLPHSLLACSFSLPCANSWLLPEFPDGSFFKIVKDMNCCWKSISFVKCWTWNEQVHSWLFLDGSFFKLSCCQGYELLLNSKLICKMLDMEWTSFSNELFA